MRPRSRFVLLVVLLVLPCGTGLAQTHLSVEIQDPAYSLLELGELRGILGRLSAVRPYPRSQVVRLLERMWEARAGLTPAEQAVLAASLQRLREPRAGLRHGNVAYEADQPPQRLQAGADARARFRLNANDPENWHLDSAARTYLRGDLLPWLSYSGVVGVTFDRVRSEEAFAPYSFTKQWDLWHMSLTGPIGIPGSDLVYPTISWQLETEIAAVWLEDRLRLSLARHRREWGVGDGSLTLGGTARPFVAAENHVQLSPWLNVHYLFGSLGNWAKEEGGIDAIVTAETTYQKLFALQRLELLPLPWLYLSATSSVIGARRFELTYLSPLLFGVVAQSLIGDLDNVGLGADLAVTLPPLGRAYVSLYVDEMQPTTAGDLFRRPRNMFALQGGLKVPVPRLPFTLLTVQYTKIEPFTYTHYPTAYPDYRMPVDTSYTHDGENLAYPLWPNSDELLVKLRAQPFPNLSAALEYRLIRHGDNDKEPDGEHGEPAILGRPDGWLNYTWDDQGLYPDKAFLRDGLYDHNHIVTLSGRYAIPRTPVTVGLSYTFSYTYWRANDSGETAPPDRMRNILGLEFEIFR